MRSLNPTKKGHKFHSLEDKLSKREYDKHLNQSDFILMPYTDPCYEKTSSNGFLEAVLTEKTPLVHPNTWMAHELKKFSLSDLIMGLECSYLK